MSACGMLPGHKLKFKVARKKLAMSPGSTSSQMLARPCQREDSTAAPAAAVEERHDERPAIFSPPPPPPPHLLPRHLRYGPPQTAPWKAHGDAGQTRRPGFSPVPPAEPPPRRLMQPSAKQLPSPPQPPKPPSQQPASKRKMPDSPMPPTQQKKSKQKKTHVPPEPVDRHARVAFKVGDSIVAYSVTEEEWLDATILEVEDGNNYRIKWADADCEETLPFLDLRHKKKDLSKKDRLVARDERLEQLRNQLPYALADLHSKEDVMMTWRTFRVRDGVAVDSEDPTFLEGPAACVANSYDVCQKMLEDAGEPVFLHKLAGHHAETFGVGTSKFLGQSFQEFVTDHFELEEPSKLVSLFASQEEAAAAKRRRVESDANLRDALTRFCQANGGTCKINKALMKSPEMREALSDLPTQTQQNRRLRTFVLADPTFRTSKSGNTVSLA
eukprot:TRINITY_DN101854_c0_g1_i1.p1 TRINITY_DN101854_c0_g1~~TRINITY_DN101854_c0_g1_i1.p1  ORF type:complete len:506 (+),score=73.73 TRINITY_DN101854_c0_g1_i1:195-1520(+)